MPGAERISHVFCLFPVSDRQSCPQLPVFRSKDDAIEIIGWNVNGVEISGNGSNTVREAHVFCLRVKHLKNLRKVKGCHPRLRETFGYR